MPDGEGNAELVLVDVGVAPYPPKSGEQIVITAQARNDGAAETGAFQARYLLQKDSGSWYADLYWPSLTPGESHYEQWQVPAPLEPGDYTYSVALDIYNQVVEGNKNDNGGQNYFQVDAPPVSMRLPDEDLHGGTKVTVRPGEEDVIVGAAPAELVIGVISVTPANIRSADPFTVGVLVRNDGKRDSGEFRVRLTMDGHDPHDETIESIAAGRYRTLEIPHKPMAGGQHTIMIQLDPDQTVVEANRQDNTDSLTFQVEAMPERVVVHPEEEEPIEPTGAEMGAGADPLKVIGELLNRYHAEVIELWTRYQGGLTDFERDLVFPSLQEAEFDPDVVLKGAAKGLFTEAIKELAGEAHVPGLKAIVGGIKGGIDAYFDEKKRSAEAKDKNELKQFIREVEVQIDHAREATGRAVLAGEGELRNEFAQAIANDPRHGRPSPSGRLEGPGGEFILRLESKLGAFMQSMPERSAFEREIAEAWINNVRWKTTVQGRLVFHIDLYRVPGGWAPSQTDSAWTLQTDTSADDRRIAEALKGTKVTDIALLKTVYLNLSTERGEDPWLKSELDFTNNPASPQAVRIMESTWPADEAEKQLREVWALPSTRELALKWTDVIG